MNNKNSQTRFSGRTFWQHSLWISPNFGPGAADLELEMQVQLAFFYFREKEKIKSGGIQVLWDYYTNGDTTEKSTFYITIGLWQLTRNRYKFPTKKIQAWTGSEPMTSAIPVQYSTNWANKPSGSWSLCEFMVYQIKENIVVCLSSCPHFTLYTGGIWKRRFHSKNASNVFRPRYAGGIWKRSFRDALVHVDSWPNRRNKAAFSDVLRCFTRDSQTCHC